MRKNLLKALLTIIIFIYMSTYLIADSGYYEYRIKQQTTITNEKIKEFEKDINNGVDINLIDYLNKDNKDYTNKFSNIIYNISTKSNILTKKIIKNLFKKLSTFIDE